MKKICIILLGIMFLGCSYIEQKLSTKEEPPPPLEETVVASPQYTAVALPAAEESLDDILQLYGDALDSSQAGSDIAAQSLFEEAIIELSEVEAESIEVLQEYLDSIRLQLATDYAGFLGNMQELPAESSPSAVYIGLSEFLGDSIGSMEDLLGVMLLVGETPKAVDALDYNQLYPDVPLIVNSYVENAIKFYRTKGHKVFSKWLKRAEEAIPYYTRILREEGMPEEIVYLAMIESGFSPRAYSRAHASGPWQFISSTARIYDLKVGYWYDERRDLDKSTRAACRYLKKLYNEFDDWYLAFAAYNCGEGRVRRAIRRSKKDDYWGVRRHLPRQTREYVPSMLAARIIGQNPEKYGFDPLVFRDTKETKTGTVKGCVSIKEVAKAAGASTSVIKNLNPALKRDCTPPGVDEYEVLIPIDANENFNELIAKAPRLERSEWIRHRIRSGESLSTIAAKYGTSMRAIMSIPSNKLRNPHKIRAGKYLLIPVGSVRGAPISEPRVGDPQPVKITTTDGKVRTIHTVRRGDALSKIAQRYKVTVSNLRTWNHLWGNRFIYPGQKLIVWSKPAKSKTEKPAIAAIGPPIPASAGKSGNQVHVVQPGDTLWDLSQLYGVSIRDLKKWNNIRSVRRLKLGSVLKLQP